MQAGRHGKERIGKSLRNIYIYKKMIKEKENIKGKKATKLKPRA